MTFQHPDLQQYYDKIMALKVTGLPDSDRSVLALMAAYDRFRNANGEESAEVQEIVQKLLSSELRPVLRNCYRRWGDKINPAAAEFRRRLSELAGEKFG